MHVSISALQDLRVRERQIEGMKEALTYVAGFHDRSYLSFRITVAERELRKAYARLPKGKHP